MLRHAVINQQGTVVNVIIWDGITPWQPKKDQIVVQHDTAYIGDIYDFQTKTIKQIDRTAKD